MKRIIIAAIALGFMVSCKHENDEIISIPVSGQLSVTYGEAFGNLPASGATVSFTNKQTGMTQKAIANEKGEVNIKLIAGVYDIMAERKVTATEMEQIAGEQRESVFTGVLQQVKVSMDTPLAITISMNTETIGSLLIKQVYYTGSDTKKGANYRDQFIEIHNNSTDVQPLAGVGIGIVRAVTKRNNQNGVKGIHYHWSSTPELQEQGEKADTDYVYVWNVYTFPADTPPLSPGKSVIVAGTAINHKSPLTYKDKGVTKTLEVAEPDLTIDLSKAPYEIYNGEYENDAGVKILIDAWDQDNPHSKNMEILYSTNRARDLILNPQGRFSLVLLSPITKEEKDTYKAVAMPTVIEKRDTDTQKQLQIPLAKVIDGVNFSNIKEDEVLGLHQGVDAGFTRSVKGPYSSESVIRKYREVNGRKVYQDTNNSSTDFEVLSRPDVSTLN